MFRRKFFMMGVLSAILATGAVFFVIHNLNKNNNLTIDPLEDLVSTSSSLDLVSNIEIKKADAPKISPKKIPEEPRARHLPNPPKIIKAVYLTSWAAGTKKFTSSVIRIAKETKINAVVIDIKDFSGFVAYDTNLPLVKNYGATEIRIPRLNALLNRLHQEGIYAIARLAVFQDPILAKARPDLAIHSRTKKGDGGFSSGTIWTDRKKLSWVDPSSREVWEYNTAIARDARNRGFDEINFDYIRFPSDGNLNDLWFPKWDEKIEKHLVVREFFRYLRKNLAEIPISADIFGSSVIVPDDGGIGQILEDAYQYFDFVSPMVYPSHYAPGTLGYQNPADYPYEIISYSLSEAKNRLTALASSSAATSSSPSAPIQAVIRPWLQDFDLGSNYDAEKVRAEISAVKDSLGEKFRGFMLWSPNNIYTEGGLEKNGQSNE